MRSYHSTALSLIIAVGTALSLPNHAQAASEINQSCIQRSQWVSPTDKTQLNTQSLLKKAARQSVVLLGEQHPDPVHHRWQLQTITQLYAYNPNIVLGFEMFPRRIQPVLDAWVRGELSKEEFLEKSDWDEVWKHDAAIYMPLFQFARMNRLPMVALNVDNDLIGEISQKGWDAINKDKKEGVKTPTPAHPDYVASLKKIYDQHSHIKKTEKKDDEKSNKRFNRFVEAQLTWDAAMAQEISRVQKLGGKPLVIGIMGSGHLANRYGVPHQLEGLGLQSTVLLPWTLGSDCNDLVDGYADAVFGLEEADAEPENERPMLGVRISEAKDKSGVLVDQTIEESIAEDAGILEGDIIIEAAGLPVHTPAELVKIVQRQSMGTWLPITLTRNGDSVEIIAKFPVSAP